MTKKFEKRPAKHGKKTAYHMEFGFRKEGVVWKGRRALRPNLYPLATELRSWMHRQGQLTFSNSQSTCPYNNPYTHDGSILSISFAQIINEGVAFSESTDLIDSTEAEIKRIRLYTEHVLYSARLCEAFIKQMLFCTAFPESHYRGSALGSLLSRDCVECAHSSNTNGHRLSLLGSLAHRYGLCRYYEGCLVDHMTIVNRRRDVEAAHSGITEFNPSTPAEARKELKEQTNKVLTELAHMLEHLGHIEQKMVAELNQMIRQATDICPVVNAYKESLPLAAA